jgi:hypothetical protein
MFLKLQELKGKLQFRKQDSSAAESWELGTTSRFQINTPLKSFQRR